MSNKRSKTKQDFEKLIYIVSVYKLNALVGFGFASGKLKKPFLRESHSFFLLL